MNDQLLTRIAEALERLAPPAPPLADLTAHPAYYWDGRTAHVVEDFAPADFALLFGIDAQKETLLENSRRHAAGYPAHDALLWGSRGTGKSASVAAVVGKLRRESRDIALMQCSADQLASLPDLFRLLHLARRCFILFIDDLSFDEGAAGDAARVLRSLLDGGASARPANVRLYVTSNRRHIVSRHMSEKADPVNKRAEVDDKLALSDRFGLSLGFHAMDQDTYLAVVEGYARHYGLPFDGKDAVYWATVRGSRSGRVAWQYVTELAGREGRAIRRGD
ncbi:MAG: ATPase [Sphingobium sp. 32-64-5]|nr:MAG: ATPase [Sphingobium sp. 32-64-5]